MIKPGLDPLKIENFIEFFELRDRTRNGDLMLRLIIGFKFSGVNIFSYKKYGGIDSEGNKTKLIETARTTVLQLNETEPTVEFQLYGYHFGMPYEVNEDEEILGDWASLAIVTVQCDQMFFMKPGCNLPDDFAHLQIARFVRPTGEKITVSWEELRRRKSESESI